MRLLEELRSESGRVQQILAEEEARQQQLQEIYEKHINPRMRELYVFLNEFANHLNIIKPDTTASYQIPEVGALGEMRQSDYRLTVDSGDAMKELTLRFVCNAEEPLVIEADSEFKAEKIQTYLLEQGLRFHRRNRHDRKTRTTIHRFEIEPRIPVTFVFSVDVETTTIELSMINFLELGVRRKSYRPHDINKEFMEDVGSFILRKNEDLLKLAISEEARERIRKRVERKKKERERELKLFESIASN
jgi:hypothetical protein